MTLTSAFAEYLRSGEFLARKDATSRYLGLLSFLSQERPDAFEKVLGEPARKRIYIGRSKDEIQRSGKNTHPRQIPGTSFWALTNKSTGGKQLTLKWVMKVLGYTSDEIHAAERALVEESE